MAEPTTSIGVPDNVDPALVNEAYKLALAEGGGTVVVVLLMLGAVWKGVSAIVARFQALMERLLEQQATGLGRVELAVTKLDAHFTAAASRLDRVEGRVEHVERDHGHRLTVLEAESAVSGVRRRSRAAGDAS